MINRVVLVGNVETDPIFEHRPDGVLIARFRMCTIDQPIDEDGIVTTTAPFSEVDMHNIECVGPWAQVCGRNVVKGVSLIVEGKLRCRMPNTLAFDGTQPSYISVEEMMFPRGMSNPNGSLHPIGPFAPVS